jgi:ketosteroid isomerase-like protein
MTTANVELVLSLFERINRGSLEAALEMLTDDFRVQVPGSMSAEPDLYEGHEGARRYMQGFDGLLEDVRWVAFEVDAVDADRVLVSMRLTGRGVTSGIQVEQDAAAIVSVRHGMVNRIEPHPTLEAAREALAAT